MRIKNIYIIILVFISFTIFSVFLLMRPTKIYSQNDRDEERTRTAVFTYVEGTVKRQKNGEGDWFEIKEKSKVRSGDRVKTAEKTKAEIELAEATYVRLDENTTINILDLYKNVKAIKANVEVEGGNVWAKVKELSDEDEFAVTSPVARASIRGTVFRVTTNEDNSTQIKVYNGEIAVSPWAIEEYGRVQEGELKEVPGPKEIEKPYKEVTLEQWVEIVRNLECITISPERKIIDKKKFSEKDSDEQSEWIKWCKQRDKKVK